MADNHRPPTPRYPLPPPPPPPRRLFNPTPRTTLFFRLLSIVLASSVAIGTVGFIIWLLLRPRLPGFRLDSLTLSNFSLSASHLTANWDVQLTCFNPNSKMRFHYDKIEAELLYRDETLADTDVDPFVQKGKALTSIEALFEVKDAHVDKWVAQGIRRERAEGRVDFNVQLTAMVRFREGFWRARRKMVLVYCEDLGVGLTAAGHHGSLVGGGVRGCSVGL